MEKAARILNLEDSPLDSEIIQANLLEGGIDCEVVRVETRADFAAALEEDGFDLILSDFVLPSFDGLSALEMSRKMRPEVPFIIISGTLGEEVAIEIMKNGATDYVLKHRLERLVPAVRRALREAEQQREREEAEEALRRSEGRFRLLMEQAADAMFAHDLEGRFVDVNRQACEGLGYTREELLAMSVPDIEMNYEPGSLPKLWKKIASGEPRTLEGVHRRKDGTTFPVELRVGMFESDGRRLMLALARDNTERKQAEEALRLRDRAVGASANGVVITDPSLPDNPIVYVNPAFELMTGYASEEVVGHNCRFLQGEDRDQPAVEELREAVQEGRECRVVLRNYKKDGTLFWNELSVSPVRDEGGQLTHFVGVQNDITERKRAEELQRKSEERFRSLVQNASDIVMILETDGTIRYESPAVERVLGFDPEERIGINVFTHMHPEDAGPVKSGWTEILEKPGERLSANYRLLDREGSWHHFEAIATNLLHDLTIRGIVVNSRDVTERKRAEEALKESEERLRTIVESVGEGLLITDLEDVPLYANPRMQELVGYGEEEMLGKKPAYELLLPPEHWQKLRRRNEDRARGIPERYEMQLKRKDGTTFWTEINATPYRNASGKIVGTLGAITDITERKEAEEALKESEERFRLLSEEALEGIALSEKGVLFDANKSFLEMYGYEPDEVIGMNVTEFMAPEDRELVAWSISSGSTQTYEARGIKKDGTVFPLEARPRYIPYRGRWALVTSFLDLTERRKAEEALRQSERLYRTVVEQVAENIFLVDLETRRILEANPALQRSLGYTAEEFERMTLYELLGHDRESIDRNTRRVVEEGGLFIGERAYRRKDGSTVAVEVSVSIVPYNGREAMCVVAHDVTERKQAEENLRQSLSVLLALREAGQILGSTLESEEVLSRLLEIMQNVLNLTAAVVGIEDEEGRIRIWRSVGLEGLWRKARFTPEAEAARRAVLEDEEHRFFSLRRPDSEPGILVGLCMPLRARDRVFGVLEAYGPESLAESDAMEVLDSLSSQAASALENARLYGEVAEREQRLQELIGRLLGAQEEERRRVAYEVHDGLAQVAVAAHQHLQAFSRRHPPETERSRKDLERVLGLVRRTVSDARKIIANLRPTALDDFGLAAAVSVEVERLREDGYRVDYEERLGDERLPNTVEITLFRVAQEALTNMRKHAGTKRVSIELWRERDEAHLEVRDYGRGFDPNAASAGSGPGERIGLAGMRERVGILGGRLEIHSRPGEGTSVVAEIPLPDIAGED